MDCTKSRSPSHAEPVISHSKSDEEVGLLFGNCASLLSESVDPSSLSQSIPYIGLEHIIQEKLHLNGTGESTDVTSTKRRFEKGNILFGKLRPYFRKVVQPDFDGICSTDIWVIEPKENVDSRFLFYWCASWDFVDFLDASSEGTRMPRAKWEVAVNHRIPTFSTHEQKAIGHILGTLDDKIKLNQKINKTLEEITKAVFKSWFVDFDPVRVKADGQPIGLPPEISGLFPDELVGSEIGEIPKGWKVYKGSELLEIQKGLSYKGKFLTNKSEGRPLINLGCFVGGGGFRKEKLKYYKGAFKERHLINQGDLLIANTDLTQNRIIIGSPILVPPLDNKHTHYLFTHHTTKVRPKKNSPISKIYLYYNFLQASFRDRVSGYSTGTTVLALPKDTFENLPIVMPHSNLMNAFEKLALPIFEKTTLLVVENEILEGLRNVLLPKLISGELPISDAEKFLKEANI